MNEYIFYIKNISEEWVAGVTDIQQDERRSGWIHYTVVHNPRLMDVIAGGISANHVFSSGNFDYGKDLEELKNPNQQP